jgi:hypothetical protein
VRPRWAPSSSSSTVSARSGPREPIAGCPAARSRPGCTGPRSEAHEGSLRCSRLVPPRLAGDFCSRSQPDTRAAGALARRLMSDYRKTILEGPWARRERPSRRTVTTGTFGRFAVTLGPSPLLPRRLPSGLRREWRTCTAREESRGCALGIVPAPRNHSESALLELLLRVLSPHGRPEAILVVEGQNVTVEFGPARPRGGTGRASPYPRRPPPRCRAPRAGPGGVRGTSIGVPRGDPRRSSRRDPGL